MEQTEADISLISLPVAITQWKKAHAVSRRKSNQNLQAVNYNQQLPADGHTSAKACGNGGCQYCPLRNTG